MCLEILRDVFEFPRNVLEVQRNVIEDASDATASAVLEAARPNAAGSGDVVESLEDS